MKKLHFFIFLFNVVSFSQSNCVSNSNLVANGSFENPASTFSGAIFVNLPYWNNLNDFNFLEIQNQFTLGLIPAQGNQYVELNGFSGANVFQTIPIDAGRPVYWSFCYARRRNLPEEIIQFIISDDNNQNIWQNTYELSNTLTWNYIEGIYYPDLNQNNIKINFISYPYLSGLGNLLDNINIKYLDCLPPEPIAPINMVLCNNTAEQITVSQLAPEDQVVWSTGETTSTITVLNPGTYTATITRNRGGCAPPLVFVKDVEVSVSNQITSPISFN